MGRHRPRKREHMQSTPEQTTTEQPQSIEQLMNSVLASILAKHQHVLYTQLMQLQKSLEEQNKKEIIDEKD